MRRDRVIAQWSEIPGSETVISCTSGEFALVITRSSVWPAECVGPVTCYLRPVASKMSQKRDDNEPDKLSMWILKSPMMIKSEE